MPLCLLPNSTPVLCEVEKTMIGSPVRILYSGTYALKDGISFLLEGVEKAVNAGCVCELILVGKGRASDMTFLDKVKDAPWIKYLGFISEDELVAKMRDCDILAMTRTNSKFANYGFPFKLSEYLATGNVVMATKVGDVPLYLMIITRYLYHLKIRMQLPKLYCMWLRIPWNLFVWGIMA